MIAPQRQARTYPVVLPQESRSPAHLHGTGRARASLASLALAGVVLAALLGHVGLQAGVATAGVELRAMRAEISQLERQRARLDAQAAMLRAPARIERIAIDKLGMRPPTSGQLAAVPVVMPARAVTASRENWFARIRGWMGNRPAAAQEQAP